MGIKWVCISVKSKKIKIKKKSTDRAYCVMSHSNSDLVLRRVLILFLWRACHLFPVLQITRGCQVAEKHYHYYKITLGNIYLQILKKELCAV